MSLLPCEWGQRKTRVATHSWRWPPAPTLGFILVGGKPTASWKNSPRNCVLKGMNRVDHQGREAGGNLGVQFGGLCLDVSTTLLTENVGKGPKETCVLCCRTDLCAWQEDPIQGPDRIPGFLITFQDQEALFHSTWFPMKFSSEVLNKGKGQEFLARERL